MTSNQTRNGLLAFALSLSLAACGKGGAEHSAEARTDPALAGALSDQIMVDPDLSEQNQAGAAGVLPSASGAVPPDDKSPQAAASARSEALALLGGSTALKRPPQPRELDAGVSSGPLLAAAARAATGTGGSIVCADIARYTTAWAAKLPKAFPVYPRGAVREAAGTDDNGCALRIVNFTSPVALGDVIAFYYTRAASTGFNSDYVRQSGDDILGGTRTGSSYIVYARALPDGGTEVDLITRGS